MSGGRSFALVVLLGAALASCGSKSNVTLSAALGDAALSVSKASPLIIQLTGGCGLDLELGAQAADGTDVSLGAFAVTTGGSQVVGLHVTAAPMFPVHLDPGQRQSVQLTIADKAGTEGQTIDETARQTLCASSDLRIEGVVTDSAQDGRATPVSASAGSVSGCSP